MKTMIRITALFFCLQLSAFADASTYTFPPLLLAPPKWPQVHSVSVTSDQDNVLIRWESTSEEQGVVYYIETSEDGRRHSTAAIVMGGFQQNDQFTYQYRIKKLGQTSITYRLTQVRDNGSKRIVSAGSL